MSVIQQQQQHSYSMFSRLEKTHGTAATSDCAGMSDNIGSGRALYSCPSGVRVGAPAENEFGAL